MTATRLSHPDTDEVYEAQSARQVEAMATLGWLPADDDQDGGVDHVLPPPPPLTRTGFAGDQSED